MDEVTQQNAALVEQASASALSLEDQVRDLSHTVHEFTLDEKATTPTSTAKPEQPTAKPRPAVAAPIHKSVRTLNGSAKTLKSKDAAKKMPEQTDQWTEF